MVDGHWNEVGFHGPGILFIENVGNLACPSRDDLGEAAKIDLLSVTEGEDKPLKHTGIVHRSALMILTKTAPLPHAEFSAELALENARKIHPEIDRHHCAIGAHRRGLGPMDGVAGRAPTAPSSRRDHLTLELNLA